MIGSRVKRAWASRWLGSWVVVLWTLGPAQAEDVPAFSPEQAAAIQTCLEEAQQRGYPTELLQQRRDEGVAKRVDPALVVQAVQLRMRFLHEARRMVSGAGYAMEAPPVRELQASVALALEAGLPEECLTAVMKKGGGQYAGRMQGAVEAGESLHLAGLDEATVRGLMEDCLDRNLRRSEMLRVTRYATQQHRGGSSGQEIRRSLWGETGITGDVTRGGGNGQGRESGSGGAGGGPGHGRGGFGPGKPQ